MVKIQLFGGTALMLLLCTPAYAQSQGASAEAPSPQSNTARATDRDIEEIVVTAQKREQRLIDVPQSISVLTGESLERQNATQFRDFADTVPGLTFTSLGVGQTQISLRGVTAGRDIAPTVGVYVDDVPYGSSTAYANAASLALDVGLFDIDRVEVLRGPQGTLYGAGSLGGVLRYITRAPNSRQFGVDLRAGLSDTRFGGLNYDGSIVVNAPIAEDAAAVRASAFYSRDGGYIDNIQLGLENINRSEVYGGRLDLLVTPAPNLSVRIVGYLQNADRDGEGTFNATAAGVPEDTFLTQRRLQPEIFSQRYRLLSGTINYDLGFANLASISSYQDIESTQTFDFSRVVVPLVFSLEGIVAGSVVNSNFNRTRKFSQEVRLSSPNDGTIEWLVGGYYTRERSDNTSDIQLRNASGALLSDSNVVLDATTDSTFEEIAGFGNLTWNITDNLDITSGIRYAASRQEFTYTDVNRTVGGKSSSDAVTYLLSSSYKFNPNAMAYVRYATGYRPGGPNFRSLDLITGQPIGLATYEPDSLSSYEIGFKGQSNDGRFGIDVAAYYIDWDNIQVIFVQGGVAAYDNVAGGARIQGGEMTLTARPFNGTSLSATFTYQDAALQSDAPRLGAVAGAPLPGVAKVSAAFNVDVRLVDSASAPTVGLTFRYVDDRPGGYTATSYRLPDYATVDLRASIRLDPVDLRLFVRNLFDVRGQMGVLVSGARGFPTPGLIQPRTIGLSLATSF